jgi:uncharacterized protein (TIGR03435 family)
MRFVNLCCLIGAPALGFTTFYSPLIAQTGVSSISTPVYEVASIHQDLNPNPRWNMYFTDDGVHAMDVTLRWALNEAYGISDDRLWSGGPGWLDKTRFDIEAKYDVAKYPNLTRDQRQAMLQDLLADRFKLAIHHESKEFPVYALVTAKGGAKLTETKPENLQKSKLYGVMCMHKGGRKGDIEMEGCTMTQFSDSLSGYARNDLGRRVIDQTGLNGYYTIALHWDPVNTSDSSSATLEAPESDGPALFTAVKEQLGLELKPIQSPIDTLVIDHVEMPTEN